MANAAPSEASYGKAGQRCWGIAQLFLGSFAATGFYSGLGWR
jgi:hypothetical protein